MLIPEYSWMSCNEKQNWEQSGALELAKPRQCYLSLLEPEPPADFLLSLPPIDQIMNPGTASDKELQLLQEDQSIVIEYYKKMAVFYH